MVRRWNSYRKVNIVVISLIQIAIYAIMTLKNIKIDYLIINFIGCMILNYMYIKISEKKESIRG